jgi:hypothetical protein
MFFSIGCIYTYEPKWISGEQPTIHFSFYYHILFEMLDKHPGLCIHQCTQPILLRDLSTTIYYNSTITEGRNIDQPFKEKQPVAKQIATIHEVV